MDTFKKLLSKIGFKDFSLGDNSWSSLTGGGRGTPLSVNSSDAQLLASNENWVFACVHKIATTVAGIELELRSYDKKGNEVEIEDHAILDLLAKPNTYQTGRDFLYMVVGHLLLTGNAYILKDQPTNPKALAVLVPSGVSMKITKDRTAIDGYEYQVGNFKETYPTDRIVHIKLPSLTNPFKGTGILSQIASWVDVDNAATEFNRLFFVNGAALSGVLETEATSEEGLLLAKRGFEQRYAGTNNAHKTAVLPKGAKYQDKTSTPHDMQFSEMDTRYRDKILAGFGVPKSIVGIVDDVNRASAEANIFVFMMLTIDPLMKWFVAYLNNWLLPSFSGTDKLYFDYDNIIPQNDDLEIRQNSAALAGQSYKTINEVRASLGLAPIDNGDYVYGGFANIPIGKPQPQQVEAGMEQSTTKETSRAGRKIKHLRAKQSIKREEKIDSMVEQITKSTGGMSSLVKTLKKELAETVHKEFIARVTTFENKFVKAVKDFSDQMEKQAIENLLTDGGKSFVGSATKELLDTAQAKNLFIGLTLPILQDLLKTEGQAQMDRLDTTLPFDPYEDNAVKRMRDLLNLTATSYTDTTLKLLATQLEQGVNNGENMDALVQRVADVFHLTDTYRAAQVARTTVFGVANSAARDAYKQSGVVRTVAWHTAEDEMVCEFCGPMDGKVIGVDESFFDKGDIVRGADGATMGVDFMGIEDPPLHPNCRCFTNAEDIEVQRGE